MSSPIIIITQPPPPPPTHGLAASEEAKVTVESSISKKRIRKILQDAIDSLDIAES